MATTLKVLGLAVAVAVTVGGVWSSEPTGAQAISAEEAQLICGAGCYDVAEKSVCSDACGNETAFITTTSYKDGYKAKTKNCNDTEGKSCQKPNFKSVSCL